MGKNSGQDNDKNTDLCSYNLVHLRSSDPNEYPLSFWKNLDVFTGCFYESTEFFHLYKFLIRLPLIIHKRSQSTLLVLSLYT